MSRMLTALITGAAGLASACGSSTHPGSPSGAAAAAIGVDSSAGGLEAGISAGGDGALMPANGADGDAGTEAGHQAVNDSGASGPIEAGHGVLNLFYLDLSGGRLLRAHGDGTGLMAIVTSGSEQPDGVVVDVPNGYLYWTNMGVPQGAAQPDDGFILRANIDGSNVKTIVPRGATHTPKQMKLDADRGEIYWCDREGMRVMRARTDGTNIETLVTTAQGVAAGADPSNYPVGIALDLARGQMYWTQKGAGPTGGSGGQGTIRRAGLQMPAGQDSTTRSDIDVLFSGLPEPIDMDLDLGRREMYWTDRGDGTVSRAPMDPPSGSTPARRTDRVILIHGAGQAIGLALDLTAGALYYTGLDTGTVSVASLDGTNLKSILTRQGGLAGITLARLSN